MSWDDASTAEQREWEKQQRRRQAAWDREHPPPKRGPEPGRWGVPAWTGPDSPQSSVWISTKDDRPYQGLLF